MKKFCLLVVVLSIIGFALTLAAAPTRLVPPVGDKGRHFEKVVRKNPILPVLVDVLYDYDKRVRVLESRPAITKVQFRAALKQRFKNRK
jgi:hypothetical protein